MWDAQDQYWAGHSGSQPKLNGGSSSDYAQNNMDSRWYHEGSGAFQATRTSCKDLPNVNEMTWYAAAGDPRWDADELWTTMGHLYKGGMWFKKKVNISGYDANTAVDGTDWRTNANGNNWSVSNTLPDAADAGNYFYLPTLGFYYFGRLNNVGSVGVYWPSSAYPSISSYAYYLSFYSGNINVESNYRYNGYRAEAFQ